MISRTILTWLDEEGVCLQTHRDHLRVASHPIQKHTIFRVKKRAHAMHIQHKVVVQPNEAMTKDVWCRRDESNTRPSHYE